MTNRGMIDINQKYGINFTKISHQNFLFSLCLIAAAQNRSLIVSLLSQRGTNVNDSQTHPLRSTAPLATRYCNLMGCQQSDQ